MFPSGRMREWVFYSVLGMIADTVDTILTIIRPPKRPQISITASDIDHLSDDELLELGKAAPLLHPDANIKKLSSGTVAKPSQDRDEEATNPSEANALNLVFASTTVPVPRVRRVVKRQWDFLIVMDYIEGPTLAQLWPTLSTWRKLLVAFILRCYIRQLRRCLKAPAGAPPGPLCADGSARTCESPVFGQVQSDRGPFASHAELSAFLNERHRMALDIKNVSQDDPARADLFDDLELLVLTHQDINLRNVVVDKEGRLWLIDWAWAGYYPVWFEYVAMQRQSRDPVIIGTDDKLWKAMIPFICGPYFEQDRWLLRMGIALYYV